MSLQGKPDLNTALPVRQTASIFKQPVTKITNHPSNKVKSDPQKAVEQPRQVSTHPAYTHTHLCQATVDLLSEPLLSSRAQSTLQSRRLWVPRPKCCSQE